MVGELVSENSHIGIPVSSSPTYAGDIRDKSTPIAANIVGEILL